MMKRLFLILVIVVMLVPSIARAAEPVTDPPTYPDATQGGHLVYGLWQDLADNLDPHRAFLQVTAQVVKPVFDSLVYMQRDDPTVYPGLATSWDISDDGKKYTFYLRDDVKFHDGTPFNAEAVKYNFDWCVNPDNQPGNSPAVMGTYASSEVIDDYTIEVNFSEPYGAFLPQLAQVWVSMQSPAAKEEWGEEYQFHLTGTGPFMLEEYVPADHVTLVRNPDYNWGPPIFHEGPAFLDSIESRPIPENATRVAALESGELNMIDGVPPQDLARLEANEDLQIIRASAGGMPWIMQVNATKPPTDELAVRQALWYGTDQAQIVDNLFSGTMEPAYWPSEKGMLGYDPDRGAVSTTDTDQAQQILEEAGWVDADGDGIREKDGQKLEVVLLIPADFGMEEFSTMLQSQYRDIGIDMSIQTLAFPAAVEQWNNAMHNLDVGFFWWPDPALVSIWYDSRFVGTCCNWSHYSDPEADELVLKGEGTVDQEARAEIYEQLFQKVLDDVAVYPLFHKEYVAAADKTLRGISNDPTGYPNFNDAYFVEE